MAALQFQPRTHLPRPSPYAAQYRSTGLSSTRSATRHVNVSDSDSDDEPPPAIKFSKVTEALLNDRPILSSPIKHGHEGSMRAMSTSRANLDTPSRVPGIKIMRKSSPSYLGSGGVRDRGSTPPRVVHLGSAQQGSARRTISISGPYPQSGAEVCTPAQGRQLLSSRTRAGSNASHDAPISSSRPGSSDGFKSSLRPVEPRDLAASISRAAPTPATLDTKYAPSTAGRTRNFTDQALPASQRLKRAPIATGNFLKSGPVRRGFRRRESEENVSPVDEYVSGAQSQASSNYTPQGGSTHGEGMRSRSDSVNTRATSVEPVSIHDFAHEKHAGSSSRPGSRQAGFMFSRSQAGSESRPASRQASEDMSRHGQTSVDRYRSTSSIPPVEPRAIEQDLPRRSASINRPFRYAPGKAQTEASDDQENGPPPTFRRNKEQELKYLGKVTTVMSDDDKSRPHVVEQTPVLTQQDRNALGTLSNNLPLRQAPSAPPPKMSVLDPAITTATAATNGAATTKSRKKRTHVVINSKIYTQMGKIGKGGSSDVFCVMAENYKTYALKKVKLDDCDDNTVRGYKGEIDLLKKLTEVDRVVRLFDWELNDDKQELVVLMEKGDTDLNRVLTMKLNGHDSKFDATFTRYHWKEMLECVQAVHEHDIVHSDLKPANFLVVQGRLKLIDFGIANAIDVDNTCNVHRDSHVGTPNYMSPESITDTNASGPGFTSSKDANGRPLKKDMRIGKSSDVWSLGCILYQMTYGRPPFAHIANQISRIMAITNHKHVIEFPDTGIGGSRVPASLKGILKRCLQREADLRPTIPQLLSDSDDFLNPEADGAVMMRQEVLDQIINKVVERCRDPRRELPTANEVAQYAPSFMVKLREMAEKV